MSETQGRCPQDGGFLGDAGCTHPNHKYSAHVERLLDSARNPVPITAADAEKALNEGFYVNTATAGVRVGFGKRLLDHIGDHGATTAKERKEKLLFAIKTVRGGKRAPNPKGGAGSFAYAKRFDEFGMLVCTDKEGHVEEAFTFFHNPKKAKRR